MKTNSNNKKKQSKMKKGLFIFLTVCIIIIFVFFIGELFLRIVPIPGVRFNCAKYDNLVGGGFYPHSTDIYRNEKGDFVKRKINKWGYFDKEHERNKIKGVYRIGFFGDSFTQAKQVPLEETFFRQIESKLKPYNVECLAFGVSGFSMLQSYLTCRKLMNFFDIDMIVYVFCENDLGDQIREIKKSKNIPYPILTENRFEIDNSFRKQRRYKERFYYKIGDYLAAHSLLIATLSHRLRLLFKHGIKFKVNEEERIVSTISSWPPHLKDHAKKLGSAVLTKWKNEVTNQSKTFVTIYIPLNFQNNGESLFFGNTWLKSICKTENIAFIDPKEEFLIMSKAGIEVFYDHFTKHGHIAFANSFVKWFKKTFRKLYKEVEPIK